MLQCRVGGQLSLTPEMAHEDDFMLPRPLNRGAFTLSGGACDVPSTTGPRVILPWIWGVTSGSSQSEPLHHGTKLRPLMQHFT